MPELNFDATTVEPAVGFDPLPGGNYVAVITDSATKRTKAGTGEYLELTFQIIDGQFQGRKVWARLNLKNPNAVAVKIARAELSAICRAVGVMRPTDSRELHDKPLIIGVKQRKRRDTDDVVNEIKRYTACGGANGATPLAVAPYSPPSPSAPVAAAAQPEAVAPPVDPNTPPWARTN